MATVDELGPKALDAAPAGAPATGRYGPALRLAMVIAVVVALTAFGLVAGDFAAPTPGDPTGLVPPGMVWIPEGHFVMGSDELSAWDARPHRLAAVGGFWMDRTEVTNKEFEKFVRQSGYVTVAERKRADSPAEPLPAKSISSVYAPPPGEKAAPDSASCWQKLAGADWRHPEGPGSTIEGREHHPVVHVAWEDAEAYACWAGKRLPTEAEWERAARGGIERRRFIWGDQARLGGRRMANVAAEADPPESGRTAAVGSFPPNRYGLCDMAGNVWEWCANEYRRERLPVNAGTEPRPFLRAMRGGSFLCSESGCAGYILGVRGKWEPGSPASHIGFRCVKSAE